MILLWDVKVFRPDKAQSSHALTQSFITLPVKVRLSEGLIVNLGHEILLKTLHRAPACVSIVVLLLYKMCNEKVPPWLETDGHVEH